MALEGFKGHDLRRSLATLVTEPSRDEFLTTRLIRDKIPGQSERYINYPRSLLNQLIESMLDELVTLGQTAKLILKLLKYD